MITREIGISGVWIIPSLGQEDMLGFIDCIEYPPKGVVILNEVPFIATLYNWSTHEHGGDIRGVTRIFYLLDGRQIKIPECYGSIETKIFNWEEFAKIFKITLIY